MSEVESRISVEWFRRKFEKILVVGYNLSYVLYPIKNSTSILLSAEGS